VEQFAEGFAALAREFKLALVGGDTTQGPLGVNLTVHGFVPDGSALLRSGARVGDALFVTGTLGDAAAGLRCLERNDAAMDSPVSSACAMLIERLNRPTPRIAQGLALRGRANACIDISDGLVADLGHICAASGVGAEIEVESLPASSALLGFCEAQARHSLQLAGGDDYELCFTAADAEAASLLGDLARSGCGATRIGRIVAGNGVSVRAATGDSMVVMRSGWEHFT
jgi:thiamine-monophosphate kinase